MQITAMGFDQMLLSGEGMPIQVNSNVRLFLHGLPVLTSRSKALTTLRIVGLKEPGPGFTQLLRTALEASPSLTRLSLSGCLLASPKNSVRYRPRSRRANCACSRSRNSLATPYSSRSPAAPVSSPISICRVRRMVV